MQSMTGFGSRELEVAPFGKVCVELKSANHKFLDMVFHLPPGFLSVEDRIKKQIEAQVKRGRITCAVNIAGTPAQRAVINKALLKNYFSALKEIKERFRLKDDIGINTLIALPGAVSLEEGRIIKADIWPRLRAAVECAIDELVETRRKEGRALCGYLKSRAEAIGAGLKIIRERFAKASRQKISRMDTDEERSSFLKETDITEEIERLSFHIRNFKNRLSKNGPIGKELDFISQEMQREANTLAAKSFDVVVSSRIIQIKSQIEKIREQVQNIE